MAGLSHSLANLVMSRPAKRHKRPDRNIGISAEVKARVRTGMSNAEIIAALPRYSAHTIRQLAWGFRKEFGLAPPPLGCRAPLLLPDFIVEALSTAGAARGDDGDHASANDIALKLLGVIVRDDLIAAILDDGVA